LADIAIREALNMPTRNVVITDHQAAMIDRLVKSGRYQNASEVLRDGLRLLETRDAKHATKLAAFREAARVGFEALDSGRYRDFETGEELREHLSALAREALTEPMD
jgi:antitoxin ParD1/3/4